MKSRFVLIVAVIVAAHGVSAQNFVKFKRIAAKNMVLTAQNVNTVVALKSTPGFISADPMQKSFLIAGVKKSAIIKPSANTGAVNLSISSPHGKTTKSIKKVLPVVIVPETPISGTESKPAVVNADGSKTVCTTRKVRMEAGYSDNNLLSPMEEVMWLGNIMDGNSILNGGYRSKELTSADRNSYPISIDLNATGAQSISTTVGADGAFNRGAFNNAVNTIKNQGITMEQSGDNGFTYSEVYSSNQVYANLSAGLSITPVSLTSKLSLAAATSSTKTSYLVQFYEIWYTATLDMQTWQLVKDINKVSDQDLVITSIKYGRMGTFLFESTTDLDSLEAYLDVAFNVNPSVAVSTVNRAGFRNVHANTSIKSYASGANGALTSLEDFLNFVKKRTWNANSTGQPIGYTLRFVKDGQIANVLTTTEFNLRSCDIIPPPGKTNVRFSVSKIEAVRDIEAWGEDICGKIELKSFYINSRGAEVSIGSKTIWNVGCSPGTWMAGVDAENPVDINKNCDFVLEGDQVKNGFIRISLDIRDGLEGKDQMGINEWNGISQANRDRGYVQYQKWSEDIAINNLKPDDAIVLPAYSFLQTESPDGAYLNDIGL